jgi:hypothetical protein
MIVVMESVEMLLCFTGLQTRCSNLSLSYILSLQAYAQPEDILLFPCDCLQLGGAEALDYVCDSRVIPW